MLYICPVCADFFDEPSLYHCLLCDCHFPPDDDHACHHCEASLGTSGYKVIKTNLTLSDVPRLCKWSESRGYKRGTHKTYTPDGRVYEGSVRVA